MAYLWEEYLIFDSDGRILIRDPELAQLIRDAVAANRKRLVMYYETPGGPGQKENLLCTCRST
jgi:hypothetical protein